MKKLFLSLLIIGTFFFSSCDNSHEPENPDSNGGLALTGHVKDWPFTSSHQLSYTLKGDADRVRDTITHSNKAEISQTGEFSFELYQEPDPSLLKNLDDYLANENEGFIGSHLDTDSLVITPADVKVAQAFFHVERNGSRISSRFGASNAFNGDTLMVKFLYVNKDVRITGYTRRYMDEGTDDAYYYYDLTLKKGWNKVIIEYSIYNNVYTKKITEGKCVFSFLLFS